jgi:hypothetical protein
MSLAGKIRALFSNGEQGWWFDPSNSATLFQDSAGTTPVTAVEQPVGLQLDSRDLSYSVFFNGTSDVISTAASSAFNFGTGDFALSAWINPSNITGVKIIIDCRSSSAGTPGPVLYLNGAALASAKNSTTVVNSGGTVLANVWSFVELTRTSGNWRIFLNGALVAGPTLDTVDYTDNSPVVIGRNATAGVQFYGGYISNARVVKGTGGVTSTVPTSALTAVPGTGILTCGVSWSGNPTIVSAGTANNLNPYTTGTGNHRFQTTSANRPVVSARVNLLTKTEQFDDAVWTKFSATITPNSVTAPNGTITADTFTVTIAGYSSAFVAVPVTNAVSYTLSVYGKSNTTNRLSLEFRGATTAPNAVFDLDSGTVISGTGIINPVGNGWYQCSVTASSISTPQLAIIGAGFSASLGDSIYIWGADLRPTNQGVGLPAYQRVNTSTDYDSTGFPVYIKPNGSNQFMVTNSINFSSTNKMTVWQGVRKLDSTGRIINELSVNFNVNNGSFYVLSGTDTGPLGAVDCYASTSRGSAAPSSNQTAQIASTAINTAVLAITHDIAGDLSTIRQNTVAGTNGTADKGTGNYGNYPAYFYARGGTSLFFNGHDYGSIARGAASTAAQITAGETYINSKTKAYT